MLSNDKKLSILRRAKEAIEAGWCKNTYATVRRGKLCVCSVGAMRLAYAEVENFKTPADVIKLARYLREEDASRFIHMSDLEHEIGAQAEIVAAENGAPLGGYGIVAFNDRPPTKQADVLSVFDRVLRRYKPKKSRRRQPRKQTT